MPQLINRMKGNFTFGTALIFFSLILNEQGRRVGDYYTIYWDFIKIFFILFAASLFIRDLLIGNINLHKFYFPIIFVFMIGIIGFNIFDKGQTLIFIFSMIYIYWSFLSKTDITHHYQLFINFGVVLSIFAIFQELLFIFTGYMLLIFDTHEILGGIIRVNSVFSEPSHFGLFMIPLVYISIRSIIFKDFSFVSKFKSLIILVGFALSMSTSAFLGGFFITMLLFKEIGFKLNKTILKSLILIIFLIVLTLNDLFIGKITTAFNPELYQTIANTSSGRSLFLGIIAIYETIINKSLLGYGFENYFHALSSSNFYQNTPLLHYFLDQGHGFMYARIFVELGAVGFVVLFSLGILSFIKTNRYSHIKLINWSAILFIGTAFFKIGHYQYPLYWYFTALLFITKSYSKNIKKA